MASGAERKRFSTSSGGSRSISKGLKKILMARETIYLVQAYSAGRGKRLVADPPIVCKSTEGARRTADRLATAKAGVVAYSTSGDTELGEYDDDPVIIFKTGRLPLQFQDE
jgi:hypothetical protein